MNTITQKVQTLTFSLKAEAGALNEVYRAFREAGVNILASWGWQMPNGEGTCIIQPAEFEKAQTTLAQLGKNPQAGYAVRVEGDDQVGAYAGILDQVAQAGINLEATDAYAVNGKFATTLFTTNEGFEKLTQTLGAN